SGAAEHEQRLKHFSSAVDGIANLGENLVTFVSGNAVRSQKLGIGVNGGQIMAQVMGDGAGHASYGRQTLGFEQSLVGLQNLTAHARECCAKLAHFASSPVGKQVGAVAGCEGPDAAGQL